MVKERTFGEFFKELRARRRLTLRQFCEDNGFDPGNISKMERGVFPAPRSEDKLEEYAKALGLKKGSAEWLDFFDRASVSNRTFNVKELKNEALIHKLPALFRTLDNKKVDGKKLDELIELIKQS